MGKFRVAVVGCGYRSGMHLRAYEHIDRAEVVACCDLDEERAQKRAAEFGLKAYADTAAMIAEQKPDLVHVVTPPTVRVDILTQLSELGVGACTIEKPLATGVADWKALCRLHEQTTMKVGVSHQFRWHPHLTGCRQALASGKLGAVQFLELSTRSTISDQGTHVLNYGMSLNGDAPVESVFGSASGATEMQGVHPGPDDTVALIRFAHGVRALWNTGSTAPVCGDPAECWQHVRLAATADRGRTEWQEFGSWRIVAPDGGEEGDFGGMDTGTANNLIAQAGFHNAMFDWISDDGRPVGTSFAQSLHEWEAVLALYASAVERRPITLAGFDPPDDLIERLGQALST